MRRVRWVVLRVEEEFSKIINFKSRWCFFLRFPNSKFLFPCLAFCPDALKATQKSRKMKNLLFDLIDDKSSIGGQKKKKKSHTLRTNSTNQTNHNWKQYLINHGKRKGGKRKRRTFEKLVRSKMVRRLDWQYDTILWPKTKRTQHCIWMLYVVWLTYNLAPISTSYLLFFFVLL